MGLLWRTEKHYRGKKRKSYIRSCPLFSAGGIFLRDPDHAYDPDGQAKADPGSSQADMRKLSKAMNGALNGRGGGSNLMAQGTFKAAESAIRETLMQEAGNLE